MIDLEKTTNTMATKKFRSSLLGWSNILPSQETIEKYWVKENGEKRKMTMEDCKEMLERQGNKCACCGKWGTLEHGRNISPFRIDHDHDTNIVRGLLCNKCNPPLGFAYDSLMFPVQQMGYMLETCDYNEKEEIKEALTYLKKVLEKVGHHKL